MIFVERPISAMFIAACLGVIALQFAFAPGRKRGGGATATDALHSTDH